MNVDKIKQENARLKDAVKHQAKELAIEKALEKVRQVAMGMKKPEDMLDICRVISKELQGLGIKEIRNIQTAIINEEKAIYLNYEYFRLHKKKIITAVEFKKQKDVNAFARRMLKDPEGFFTKTFKGAEIKAWMKYQAKAGQYIDPQLKKINTLHYYFYSIGPGALGVSSYAALNKEQISLFKRFRNVFQLAYQRFIDIQKAEAQAREARIQLALERVRARTMAMQKSEELKEVIQVVYEQFVHLNILVEHAGFIMDYKERDDMNIWLADQHEVPFQVTIPYFNCAHWNSFNEAKKKGIEFFANQLKFEEKNRFYKNLFKLFPVPDETKKYYLTCPGLAISTVLLENIGLYIENFSGIPYTDEENNTLMRFGRVFQQTYTRFLDLQKAEAQAREAQIEAALERVRSRAMAMHKTNELLDAAELIHKELSALGINSMNVSYAFVDEDEKYGSYYSINPVDGKILPIPFVFPHNETQVMRSILSSWKKQEPFNVIELDVKATLKHQTYIGEHIYEQLAKNKIPFSIESFLEVSPKKAVLSTFNFKKGYLFNIGGERLTKPQEGLMLRFTKVFEQTYTRFLDLQKAEAQAREAQIELALERIRARTMAMHNSAELSDTSSVLFHELKNLGVDTFRSGVGIFNRENHTAELWLTAEYNEKIYVKILGMIDVSAHPVFQAWFDAWERNEPNYQVELIGDGLRSYYETISRFVKIPHQQVYNKKEYGNSFFFGEGTLNVVTTKPLTDEEFSIMLRFARVFGLLYRRFLDLLKAEAQAKEAHIEAGLERVRSRAMGMQTSEELSALIGTVFAELTKLDLILTRCVIMIYEGGQNGVRWWMANSEAPSMPMSFFVKYSDMPFFNEYLKGWLDRSVKWQYILEGENKIKTDAFLFNKTELSQLPDFVIAGMRAPDRVYLNASFNSFGNLTLASLEPLSEEHFKILLRFANVFDLTYTRFNDLKQAEAQAREAQIEVSLERVRSKAMAMHKSEDLNEAVATVFEELDKLDLGMIRCGIGILNKEKRTGDVWTTAKSGEGNMVHASGDEPMDIHALLQGAFEAWLRKEDFSYVLEGEDFNCYYKALTNTNFHLPESISFDTERKDQRQFYHVTPFESGTIFAFCEAPFTDEARSVMKRFAGVFNLTYKRFQDLQRAEAQARDAQIEAALEKVRAKVMGMRNSQDLNETSLVFGEQLRKLGMDWQFSYFWLIEEDKEENTFWITWPDNKTSTTTYSLTEADENFGECLVAWKKQEKIHATHVPPDGVEAWLDTFKRITEEAGGVAPQIMQKDNFTDGVYYYDAMIRFGSFGILMNRPINDEEKSIQIRFATEFERAYTRFLDLQKAEALASQAEMDLVRLKEEKKRTEEALRELKATQTQLIQSEKMASLGELTAGIAHEIQNPLNFVNNFSDVSNELLQEMKTELEKGNKEDAIAIAQDVKQNLEKILHHGKRADGIVKSMLQHSRSSSGKKELTDINNLADEYLRLSYHGLRAKDKSFQAKFETSFDPSVEKLNIIPQEIGRVILNLVNNAFYAVSEKKKQIGDGFEPTVTVSTKKYNGVIEVKVKDNGMGMPQKVLEKIFQPFFTTKPTGQGTGLGLSLSYDIITKTHGGELKAETIEGAGSEFIIQLPAGT